jgi:hypothetical protein
VCMQLKDILHCAVECHKSYMYRKLPATYAFRLRDEAIG